MFFLAIFNIMQSLPLMSSGEHQFHEAVFSENHPGLLVFMFHSTMKCNSASEYQTSERLEPLWSSLFFTKALSAVVLP